MDFPGEKSFGEIKVVTVFKGCTLAEFLPRAARLQKVFDPAGEPLSPPAALFFVKKAENKQTNNKQTTNNKQQTNKQTNKGCLIWPASHYCLQLAARFFVKKANKQMTAGWQSLF